MIKRPTLDGRKRTSELAPGSQINLSKKDQLAQLQVEAEHSSPTVALATTSRATKKASVPPPELVAPQSKQILPQTGYSKAYPSKPQEMLAYLNDYAHRLAQSFTNLHEDQALKEQKEMLRQEIGTLVNQRAQQLMEKGVNGKPQRMQCEALLYTLTEGLKKQSNIDLRGMRLVVEKCPR